jgi:hypothetical protein
VCLAISNADSSACDADPNANRDAQCYAKCLADGYGYGYTPAPSNAQAAANTISSADSVTVAGMD